MGDLDFIRVIFLVIIWCGILLLVSVLIGIFKSVYRKYSYSRIEITANGNPVTILKGTRFSTSCGVVYETTKTAIVRDSKFLKVRRIN